jgi:hypothetical protein
MKYTESETRLIIIYKKYFLTLNREQQVKEYLKVTNEYIIFALNYNEEDRKKLEKLIKFIQDYLDLKFNSKNNNNE